MHPASLQNPNAFLCSRCGRLLRTVARLQGELENSVAQVQGYLDMTGNNHDSTTAAPRKGLFSDVSTSEEEDEEQMDTSAEEGMETNANNDGDAASSSSHCKKRPRPRLQPEDVSVSQFILQ